MMNWGTSIWETSNAEHRTLNVEGMGPEIAGVVLQSLVNERF